MRPPRRELIERVAHALVGYGNGWGDSTLRESFEALGFTTRESMRVDADALLDCLRKAGLVVTVRGRGKRG